MNDIDDEGLDKDFIQPVIQAPDHEVNDRGNGRRRAIVAQHFSNGLYN